MVYIRYVHEVRRHVSPVLSELIASHQRVNAIMDMSGNDQLQTAMVLRIRDFMDFSPDVLLLLQQLPLVVPVQIRPRVACHSERDAPVLVPHRLVQLHDSRGN